MLKEIIFILYTFNKSNITKSSIYFSNTIFNCGIELYIDTGLKVKDLLNSF